jgi:glycosyltransferase involved in cell wall biosynthesis
MRILIALTYYRPHYSGLTIHAEREARSLAERGHQVTVLTSRFDHNLPAREKQDGVEIIRPDVWLRISKGVIMPSMLGWAWKLAQQADVIHLHAPQLDAAPIAVIARLLGKPVVLTYHCDMHLPHGIIHSVANLVSNAANHVTARAASIIVHNTRDYAEYSPFMRRYLEKLQPILPPVEVAPINETDRQAFREKFKIQPGQRIIGMAARLATEKGAEYLAEAMPMVLKKFPQARVLFVGPYQHVVGEEAYAQRLFPLIEQLSQQTQAVDPWSFLGILSPAEMTAFFQECEVTVLPSINSTESYGLVQVESITCGTPVVASDLPGVRVPVQMSGAGLTVPPANPDQLAKAIIAILEKPQAFFGQPEELIRLSTSKAVAAAYETVFRLALEKTNHPTRSGAG